MLGVTRLEPVLEQIIQRWEIPGLGVGIVTGGEITYSRVFGYQSLQTREPLAPDSLICVASISKPFTATAVMQLAERGRLSIDEPVSSYLPYFTMADPRCGRITIRQMLSHTSGMPDFDEYEYDGYIKRQEIDEGAAERLVRSLYLHKLVAAPGERFQYSNIAYDVLGDLITKTSGQSFETYLKENILVPAGMPESTFFYPEVPVDKLAVPHVRTPEMIVRPVYPYHRAEAPSSFLHSSIIEMCHWCITSLNAGVFNGIQIIKPPSYDLMWNPEARWGYPPFYEDMGLGWALGRFEGRKTISHGGMGFGWTHFMILFPENNQAVIILSNQESFVRRNILDAVLKTMFGGIPKAGPVSWVVPICHALHAGGIQAAYDCYDEITRSHQAEFTCDADDLCNLTYQLISADKISLAIEVLKLNLRVFPKHIDSYLALARLHLQMEEPGLAEHCIQNALAIDPTNSAANSLSEFLAG